MAQQPNIKDIIANIRSLDLEQGISAKESDVLHDNPGRRGSGSAFLQSSSDKPSGFCSLLAADYSFIAPKSPEDHNPNRIGDGKVRGLGLEKRFRLRRAELDPDPGFLCNETDYYAIQKKKPARSDIREMEDNVRLLTHAFMDIRAVLSEINTHLGSIDSAIRKKEDSEKAMQEQLLTYQRQLDLVLSQKGLDRIDIREEKDGFFARLIGIFSKKRQISGGYRPQGKDNSWKVDMDAEQKASAGLSDDGKACIGGHKAGIAGDMQQAGEAADGIFQPASQDGPNIDYVLLEKEIDKLIVEAKYHIKQKDFAGAKDAIILIRKNLLLPGISPDFKYRIYHKISFINLDAGMQERS